MFTWFWDSMPTSHHHYLFPYPVFFYTIAFHYHTILLSLQSQKPFTTLNASVDPACNANTFESPDSGALSLLHLTKKKKNWLKLNILVSWLVLVNIVPNILTGLSLHNWWILFLNCQILSIFFDSESLCGHASPSQFHHRYSLNWLVSSLKRINPDNWHSLTQAQRKHSQVMSRRCQNIHSSQSIQWEISLTTSCCTV